MPAGYSATSLRDKLGINPRMKILLIGSPENYFELLQDDLSNQFCKDQEQPDFIHLFAKSKSILTDCLPKLKAFASNNPRIIIWISWYKKSSGISTDITENDIRNIALKNDLVDVKVCAVSELWSGLKFVVPKAKR